MCDLLGCSRLFGTYGPVFGKRFSSSPTTAKQAAYGPNYDGVPYADPLVGTWSSDITTAIVDMMLVLETKTSVVFNSDLKVANNIIMSKGERALIF